MQEHQATPDSRSLWAPPLSACLFSCKPRPNQHFFFQASFPSSLRSAQFSYFLSTWKSLPTNTRSADSCLPLHFLLGSEASQNEASQRSGEMFTSMHILTTSPNLLARFRTSGTPVFYSLQFQTADSKLIKTEPGSFLRGGVLLKGRWHF